MYVCQVAGRGRPAPEAGIQERSYSGVHQLVSTSFPLLATVKRFMGMKPPPLASPPSACGGPLVHSRRNQ